MKNISKLFTYLILAGGLVFTSCETTELELLDDPNNVTADKASLDRYLNEIQLDFASFMRQMGNNAGELTRINYMFGRQYVNNFEPAVLDGEWSIAYAQMFSDMAAASILAQQEEANKHLGIMNVLKAYTLITLVDHFGDVPFSQATNPTEFPAPIADPGADVYQGALDLLDTAIIQLNEPGEVLENDFFYNNNFNKWIKLANTIKMMAYLNLGDYPKFNAIANNTSLHISSNDDDFQFTYGSNDQNPDTRHPSYSADYNVSGAGSYESNWLMDKMLNLGDPRIRYYYYRQTNCTPGASCNPGGSQTTLTCSVAPRPVHFPADMIFCSVEDGYWGRDHGNAEGIPPDGFTRTANGVYPAGGKFDDDEFSSVAIGDGGGGAGIVPLMLSAWADLMKAEVALDQGAAGSAAGFINSALTKHIAKVQAFSSLDPDADSAFFPTSAQVNGYIGGIVSSFNAGTPSQKWEILAEQKFIAHFGNANDAYNFYRRTGYPEKVQYVIDPNMGPFIRSFFYPANEANVNSNITQKPNVSVQVFWDNNPPSQFPGGYPKAN